MDDDKDLMNRYLYVGISRVTGHWQLTSSHLAAILNTKSGNEEILKYFNRNAKDWKV